MVITDNEMKRERVDNAFKGDGHLDLVHILEGAQLTGKLEALDLYILPERCSLGKHFYVGETAYLYCLEGSGVIDDNGELKEIETGDGAIYKSGEFFSVRNGEIGKFIPADRPALKLLVGIILDKHTTKEDGAPIIKIKCN